MEKAFFMKQENLILILIAFLFVAFTLSLGYFWLSAPPNLNSSLDYPSQNLHNIVEL